MTTLDHTPVHPANLDPESVFDRDRFLLRQKLLAISAKYSVSDEDGREIIYVERPAYALRGILILLATVILLIVVILGSFILAEALLPSRGAVSHPAQPFVFLGFLLAGITLLVAAAVAMFPKRHVHFYLDRSKQRPLLHVRQMSKWQLVTATYTVTTADGEALAILKKNYLWNFIRRRWRIYEPDGAYLALALEDSILKSILRRVLGQWGVMIRTNFNILTPTGEAIGAFNRKFTILDKYVLDMSQDTAITLDRRVALALGVMLDTAERR